MAFTDEVSERAGGKPKPIMKHILRPRTILYTALWSLVGVGLVFALFIRSDIDLTVAPVRNPTYVTLSDGSIRNTYEVRIRNMQHETREFEVTVKGDPAIKVELEGATDGKISVNADEVHLQRVYLVAPAGSEPATEERSDVRIWIEDLTSGERAHKDTIFNGEDD
jgi:polyferredoxin